MACTDRIRGGSLAALALLLAVAVVLWLVLRVSSPVSVRAPDIRAITGEEQEEGARLILAWEGGGPPFQVVLHDENGDAIWRSPELPRALVVVPPDVGRQMVPGRAYTWSVEGLDARGRPYRSPGFRLRIRPAAEPPTPA